MIQLALGCANLGNDYGPAPVLDYERAKEIIQTAYEGGIRWFDTAAAYGKSQEWLGSTLDAMGAMEARIITKIPPKQDEEIHLLIDGNPWAILCHDFVPTSMGHWTNIHEDDKPRIGASVDTPEEAQKVIDIGMDVLQVPASVFDRRFQRAGIFEKAHEAGMTVFVRSVYCRGRVFEPTKGINYALAVNEKGHLIPDEQVRKLLSHISGSLWFDTDDWQIAVYCFWYVRNMAPHAIPVISADTPEQVEENIRIAKLFEGWDECFTEDDPQLYPENW